MCIKCRNRLQQDNLIRLQIKDGGIIEWENIGRSFYLCEDCITSGNCINSIYKANKIKINYTSNKDIFVTQLKEIYNKWQKKR